MVGVLIKLIKSLISSTMAAMKNYEGDKLFVGEINSLWGKRYGRCQSHLQLKVRSTLTPPCPQPFQRR